MKRNLPYSEINSEKHSEINHIKCSPEILYTTIIREINSEVNTLYPKINNVSSVAAHDSYSSNNLYSSSNTLYSEQHSEINSKTLYSNNSYSKNLYTYSIHAYTLTGRHNRETSI